MFSLEQKSSFFFKAATIETDMAKRIMLSIIPMFKSENSGYDLIALKSAVNGAKDLIKYGAQICYKELLHLEEYFIADVKDLHSPNYVGKVEDILYFAKQYNENENYHKLLEICKKGFALPGWNRAFGGKKWEIISDNLLQISTKYNELEASKYDNPKDPEKSFLLMKEIIVLMNTFDGLAHNTGNVLTNLLRQEYKEHRDNLGFTGDPYYIRRVETIMDAKELEDPIEVYRQIEHIINQTPYRMIFRDYINKLKSHPSYHKYDNRDVSNFKLNVISLRKKMPDLIHNLNAHIKTIYDEYHQSQDDESFYSNIISSVLDIKDIVNMIISEFISEGGTNIQQHIADIVSNIQNQFIILNKIKTSVINLSNMNDDDPNYSRIISQAPFKNPSECVNQLNECISSIISSLKASL